MAEWYTPETVVEVWPDADGIPEALLAAMLDIARGDVLAYAPASVEGSGEWVDGYYVAEAVPNRYVHAQLRQAQNIWRADSITVTGNASEGEFVYTPHPLDWHVKQLIRPRRGAPTVG